MKKHIIILCLLLGSISAGITFYQSLQMTHLVDYAYQIEIAYRIFSGQMPYRDFMLVLTPGLYMLMALIMTVTRGYTHYGVVFQSIFTQALVVVITFLLFYRILKHVKLAFLFSIPLLFVGHAIYPFPVYDVLAVLGMMICFLLLVDRHIHRSHNGSFLLGIAVTLPLYVKQNIGFIFLFFSFFAAVCVVGIYRKRIQGRHIAVFFLGFFLSVGVFTLWLVTQHSFSDFLYQTLTFPSKARDPSGAVDIIIRDYLSVWRFVSDYLISILLFMIGTIAGYILLYKRYIRTRPALIHTYEVLLFFVSSLMMTYLVYFFIQNDAVDGKLALTFFWGVTFVVSLSIGFTAVLFHLWKNRVFPQHMYIPIMVIFICHAGFLSQSIAGSHYGMWPLLLLLMVWTVSLIQQFMPHRIIAGVSFVWIASITLYLFWYSMTNQFVGYVDMTESVYRSKTPPLQGLSAPGPWIPAFEALLAEVKNIPYEDTMAFLPGDDVFFAATGRIPTLHCSQWNVGTCDVFGFDLVDEIREKDIDWIIVKEPVMTGFAYPVVSWIPVDLDYEWYKSIEGIYTIYKKR